MKNADNKTENTTIINGLVLTNATIDALKGLQNSDNDLLKCNMDILADAVGYVNETMDNFEGEEFKEAVEMAQALSALRKMLNKLKKP